jgi:hypothetical protein
MALASFEVRVPVLERPPTRWRTRQSHKPSVSVQGLASPADAHGLPVVAFPATNMLRDLDPPYVNHPG